MQTMSLTRDDLKAIKRIFDDSFDLAIEEKIQPRLDHLENMLMQKLSFVERQLNERIDQLAEMTGQFSLEVSDNFAKVNQRLDDLERRDNQPWQA